MPAALGTPSGSTPLPAVLVISDPFGLTEHIREVTARLASRGYVALAPDLYYRDTESVIDYSNPDKAIDRVMRTIALSDAPEERVKDDQVIDDLGAALATLVERPEVDAGRIGVLGFSTGGRLAYLLACRRPREIRTAVAFYPAHMVPALDEAGRLPGPLLLIFGEDDPDIAASEVDRIQAELRYLGKPHEVRTYPGQSHSFVCDRQRGYDPAAADHAWQVVLDWLGRNLAPLSRT